MRTYKEISVYQINKKYVQTVSDYTGKILLVAIAYDKKSKEHDCIIEEFRK